MFVLHLFKGSLSCITSPVEEVDNSQFVYNPALQTQEHFESDKTMFQRAMCKPSQSRVQVQDI